jgi:hypothetical protein
LNLSVFRSSKFSGNLEPFECEPRKGRLGDTSVIHKILIVVLAAFAFWLMLRVGEGEREFRESQQALRRVTSWRQEIRVGDEVNQQAAIMCPDDERGPGHTASQPKDGEKSDPKAESSGKPPEKSEYVPRGTAPCEKLAHGEHLYPLPDYDHLIQHTRIVKGAVDTVRGLECQEWITNRVVSGRFAPAQPLDNAQICIGLHDHLPRRVKYENAEYIFYDWNTFIQIERSQVPRAPLP